MIPGVYPPLAEPLAMTKINDFIFARKNFK